MPVAQRVHLVHEPVADFPDCVEVGADVSALGVGGLRGVHHPQADWDPAVVVVSVRVVERLLEEGVNAPDLGPSRTGVDRHHVDDVASICPQTFFFGGAFGRASAWCGVHARDGSRIPSRRMHPKTRRVVLVDGGQSTAERGQAPGGALRVSHPTRHVRPVDDDGGLANGDWVPGVQAHQPVRVVRALEVVKAHRVPRGGGGGERQGTGLKDCLGGTEADAKHEHVRVFAQARERGVPVARQLGSAACRAGRGEDHQGRRFGVAGHAWRHHRGAEDEGRDCMASRPLVHVGTCGGWSAPCPVAAGDRTSIGARVWQ